DSLCAELASLLQEAVEMKWPFVPEKWQYKQSVSPDDKSNLNDLISRHLPQLLALLKASIVAQEPRSAMAVVLLVDRFLYWIDESSRLLKIAKLLHRRHHDVAIAPQLVIRQARVYLNSGKLQKAEYILSSLIYGSGATGSWVYHSEPDRVLVQSVSTQVRGMILQKLGLWLDAAELIWASLVVYFALPEPDKKGIGTSLGILANILVSMNIEDFEAFRANANINFVRPNEHGLYLWKKKLDIFISIYSSSFEIGLLTKAEGDLVTSQQELHTLIKAAYSLILAHKWMGTDGETLAQATQACQNALANLYQYCHANTKDKDDICSKIMNKLACVKVFLRVEPFSNSDTKSFIPDSYKHEEGVAVNFTFDGFSEIMRKFHKYHASLSKTTERKCRGSQDEPDGGRLCLTALGTTIDTDCDPENKRLKDAPEPETSNPSHKDFPVRPEFVSTLGSAGGSLPSLSSHSDGFAVMQADIVTLDTDVDENAPKQAGLLQSLSQLALKTSSSSLGDSFGSQSSWEKVTADPSGNSFGEIRPVSLSNIRGSQSSKSQDSDGSFFILETVNSDFSDLDLDQITRNHTSASPPQHSQAGPSQCAVTETSTESSFEMMEKQDIGEVYSPEKQNPQCYWCLNQCALVDGVAGKQLVLSKEDYQALLAGVCHECLMKRLQSHKTPFQIKTHGASYNALRLKFSKATGLWTAMETCVYIGDPMGMQGTQRAALWVQFLHQEERLSSYVGKDYLKPKEIKFHLKDVERQMTAQHYVSEFNKSLYDKEVLAQIFFIPSEALLILDGDVICGCLSVEPYMLGDFVKLTNNTGKKVQSFPATQYALAFGHFTYLLSAGQEVVVDLQGWVTANGKGLTYLTDPQIHSTRTPKGPSNFAERGLRYFVEEQHGPECNGICRLLKRHLTQKSKTNCYFA
uniref:Alpha-type protein kinase domain-containing protein n=1 Tax=Gouania willdenowi TaxID=441366 RepID=A0A8C5G1L9_GOUWI